MRMRAKHWIVIIAALSTLLFLTGCADILRVHQAANMRDAAIRQALAGDGILTASPYPVKTKYSAQYGLLDLAEDENWPKDMKYAEMGEDTLAEKERLLALWPY